MSDLLLDLLRECTVHVHGARPGAGFFVAPGVVVTCAHVVGSGASTGARVKLSRWSENSALAAGAAATPDGIVTSILPHADEDLAILELVEPVDHPCVMLGSEVHLRDPVFVWGFPDYGEGRGSRLDGLAGAFVSYTELPNHDARHRFLKFTGDRVIPGFSGGPLLDLRTGLVTGVVTETLDGRLPLGGWAIPVSLLEERFPKVAAAHGDYHARHTAWRELLPRDRRVAWADEPLPANFVPRTERLSEVVRILVDDEGRPQTATVSIVGFGGFGKTMLAREALRDQRVREAFESRGALWVTLGERPGDPAASAADLVELLTGSRPGFVSIDAAMLRLRNVLDEHRPLLVIDDVWRASDARALLGAARGCACIVTGRQGTAVPDGPRVDLDGGMSADESMQLLSYGLPSTDAETESALEVLAGGLRHWPILLSLANAALRFAVRTRHRPLNSAIADARMQLEGRGLTAFDPADAQQRTEAVALTVEASLRLLEPDERRRFQELGVFPEDAAIPWRVMERLWRRTGGLSSLDASTLVGRLIELSLLTPAMPERATTEEHVRLHDVLRAHLLAGTAPEALAALHGTLLDAVEGPWSALPTEEQYLWEWLGWHLVEAKRGDTLAALLVDFDWIQRRLEATDVFGLLSDYRRLPPAPERSVIERAIRLSAHALAVDGAQLAPQLTTRLREAAAAPVVELRERAREAAARLPIAFETETLAVPGRLVQTLVGHTSVATCMRLSADGGHLLSGGWDGTVRSWDLATGACEDTFESGGFSVSWVAFFDEDTRVIAVTQDSQVVVWELATRRVLLDVPVSVNTFCDAALTADEEFLIVATWREQMDVWHLPTNARLPSLQGIVEAATCVLTAADRAVFAGDAGGFVRRWRLGTAAPVWSTEAHVGRVAVIALSPDGSLLASVSDDGTLAVVDAATGKLRYRVQAHETQARDVRWALGGRRLVSCSQAGDIAFHDADGGAFVARHALGVESVNVLAVTPDAARVLSGDTTGAIRLWDAETTASLGAFTGHTYGIWAIETSSDGARAVSASGDWTLRVWDLTVAGEESPIAGHRAAVTGLVLPRRGLALSGGADGTLRLLHEGGGSTEAIGDLGAEILRCAAQPDDQLVALGLEDGSIVLWDVESRAVSVRWQAHEARVERLAWSADGARLATSHHRIARAWDVDGHVIDEVSFAKSEAEARLLTFVDGDLVVVAADRHSGLRTHRSGEPLGLYGRRLREADDDRISGLAVSPDGAWIVSEAVGGPVRLWDLCARATVASLDRWPSASNFLRVSRDGKFVTAGSYEGDCWVWRASAPMVTLSADAGPATDAQVTADGAFVVTQSAWAVGVWELATGRRLAAFTADGYFTRTAVEDRGSTLRIVTGDALGRVHAFSVRVRGSS